MIYAKIIGATIPFLIWFLIALIKKKKSQSIFALGCGISILFVMIFGLYGFIAAAIAALLCSIMLFLQKKISAKDNSSNVTNEDSLATESELSEFNTPQTLSTVSYNVDYQIVMLQLTGSMDYVFKNSISVDCSPFEFTKRIKYKTGQCLKKLYDKDKKTFYESIQNSVNIDKAEFFITTYAQEMLSTNEFFSSPGTLNQEGTLIEELFMYCVKQNFQKGNITNSEYIQICNEYQRKKLLLGQ